MSENLGLGLGQTSDALFSSALTPTQKILWIISWVEAFIISKVAVSWTKSWTKNVRIFHPENKVVGTWFKQFHAIKLIDHDLNVSNQLSFALWWVKNLGILIIYSIRSVKVKGMYPLDIRMCVSNGQLWVRPMSRSKRLW